MENIQRIQGVLAKNPLTELYFEEVGGGSTKMPEWAKGLIDIGIFSSFASIDWYASTIVLTLPVIHYASALLATGVLKGCSLRETNPVQHFDSELKNFSHGDSVILDRVGKKPILALYKTSNSETVSFITSKGKKNEGDCLEIVPIKKINGLSHAGMTPKGFRIGQEMSFGNGFEKIFYGESRVDKYLGHILTDCAIVGNMTQFRSVSSKFGYASKLNNKYENILISDLLKVETAENARRSSKTCLISKDENLSKHLDKIPTTSTIIYESPRSWLNGPRVEFQGTSIILLDRSHYRYQEHALELKECIDVLCRKWESIPIKKLRPDIDNVIGGFFIWKNS